MSRKTMRNTALWTLALAVLATGALLMNPAVSAEKTFVRSTGHDHHRPPTQGSQKYQYAKPVNGGPEGFEVFDPEVPAPTKAENGVREFELVIDEDVEHEVAPGLKIPVWAFNGTVPGPVLRVTEGDLVRIKLVNNGKVPHTIHFHGVHPAKADGVFEVVPPGGSYVYEFVARPYGIMPYHCHTMPASQHIQNGLYGMMIVDPKEGRKPMRELAMVMSAFDIDRDGEADFYAWNGKAFQYATRPVELESGEPVRMYVMNTFEEAMVPHIHGNMYQLYPTGTTRTPTEYTDVKTLNIAERAILEFTYDDPGTYMFQCHVSEHMEQGLMGWFRVAEKGKAGEKALMTRKPAAATQEHAH